MSQNYRKSPKTPNEQLIDQATLQNRFYTYTKIQPSVFFWKELTATSTQTPMCLVPDTLILNQKQSELIWIYTDASGRICKDTNVSFKDFVNKVCLYSTPNQLVAVLKRPVFSQRLAYCNDFKLLNSRYLMNSSQQQMGQKQHVMCLQRFIKSNGSKAFICRTIYSTESSSECFLITNSRNFHDKTEAENKKFVVKAGDKSTIVRSKQGKNLEETLKYLKEIVQYLVFFRGVRVTEIVGDFIKDQMGNWWLINIKAIKLTQKPKKNPTLTSPNPTQSSPTNPTLHSPDHPQKQRYQKTKLCRYCQKTYLESQLKYKMTMRMIIEVDKYLLHMGKEYNWLKRSNVDNIDSYFLYQEHRVCQRCFRLYHQIQELMGIQRKLLVKQGCQLNSHPKELIFSQTNEQHLRLQAKNKQIHRLSDGIPSVIELGPNTNITTTNSYPIKNDEIINRMVRFRLIIFLNQIDQVTNITTSPGTNNQLNYYLEFNLFNKKSKFKLNLGMAGLKVIPLNKLKVFYFFAHSIQNLEQEYIGSNASLKIYITTQHKETQEKRSIGSLELPFKDLVIPINGKKDFYKFFHMENTSYGWGLQGSIGVIPSEGQVSTAKISFEKTQGKVYIPNQNYYFCEHLTQEWMDLIKTKNQKAFARRALMSIAKLATTQLLSQSQSRIVDRQSRRSHVRNSTKIDTQAESRSPLRQLTLLNKPNPLKTQAQPQPSKTDLQKQIQAYETMNSKSTKSTKNIQKPKLFF